MNETKRPPNRGLVAFYSVNSFAQEIEQRLKESEPFWVARDKRKLDDRDPVWEYL